jgi:uroporphyrinogen III methyltransferase/synthase
MGIAALPDICRGLLAAGIKPDLPVALLQQGTSAQQKKWIHPIKNFEAEMAHEQIISPAIFVVGDVCRYAQELAWYDQLPLAGKRIMTTRPRNRNSVLASRLRELGAEVLELPMIITKPLEQVGEQDQFRKELQQLSQYNYLVFTSPTGVDLFFERMKAEGLDIRKMGNAQIAVIGTGTKAEVEKHGLFVDWMPDIYDGQELGRLLSTVLQAGDQVLIPRAKEGNPQLVLEMSKVNGVTVVDLPIYETVYSETMAWVEPKKMIEEGEISMVVFTSASTVNGFAAATKGLDYRLVKAACIGSKTQAAARLLGMETFVAKEATIDQLVKICEEIK